PGERQPVHGGQGGRGGRRGPQDGSEGGQASGLLAPVRFDEGFLARARANLDAFERRGAAVDGRKAAAVAVVLVPDGGGRACFLLTRRAPTLRAHTGQWALPGGRVDVGETPEQAALRELDEEVGLRLPGGASLGLLDDYPTRSGFVITPVVFSSDHL